MPPSENLGNIRLTLDNIYDDMYKEQQHIPRIQEEGWRLNLWQLWKMSSLCLAALHLSILLFVTGDLQLAGPYSLFLGMAFDRLASLFLYAAAITAILSWIVGSLLKKPALTYQMFGIYVTVMLYVLIFAALEFISALIELFLPHSSRNDFEDGVHYSLLVLMLSLVAVLSFPYPVMSLYRWWREVHALPVEVVEPPRTIGEIPIKMIYYI